MKNFYIAIRSLSKKGRHSGIKILSLGVGLAMGLVLKIGRASCRERVGLYV